jgi:hypothetical protein
MGITLRYTEVLMSGNDSPCHEISYVIVVDGDGDANEKKITKSDNMFTERMHGFSITHPFDYNLMVERAKEKGVLKWVAQESGNVISDILCTEVLTEPVDLAEPVTLAVAAAEPRMIDETALVLEVLAEPVDLAAAEPVTQAVAVAAAEPVTQAVAVAAAEPVTQAVAVAAADDAFGEMRTFGDAFEAERNFQVADTMEMVNVGANMVDEEIDQIRTMILDEGEIMAKIVDIPNIGQSLVCKRKQHCYLRPATPGMTRQLGSAKTHAFVNGGRLPGQGSCGNYCVSRFSSNNLSAIDIAKSRALAQFL